MSNKFSKQQLRQLLYSTEANIKTNKRSQPVIIIFPQVCGLLQHANQQSIHQVSIAHLKYQVTKKCNNDQTIVQNVNLPTNNRQHNCTKTQCIMPAHVQMRQTKGQQSLQSSIISAREYARYFNRKVRKRIAMSPSVKSKCQA